MKLALLTFCLAAAAADAYNFRTTAERRRLSDATCKADVTRVTVAHLAALTLVGQWNGTAATVAGTAAVTAKVTVLVGAAVTKDVTDGMTAAIPAKIGAWVVAGTYDPTCVITSPASPYTNLTKIGNTSATPYTGGCPGANGLHMQTKYVTYVTSLQQNLTAAAMAKHACLTCPIAVAVSTAAKTTGENMAAGRWMYTATETNAECDAQGDKAFGVCPVSVVAGTGKAEMATAGGCTDLTKCYICVLDACTDPDPVVSGTVPEQTVSCAIPTTYIIGAVVAVVAVIGLIGVAVKCMSKKS